VIKSLKKRNGFALITVLMISVIVIITTGVVLLRITNMSRELVTRERVDKSLAMTDAVISNSIDWLNNHAWSDSEPDPFLKPQNTTNDSLEFVREFFDPGKTATATGYSLMKTTTDTTTPVYPPTANPPKATGLIVDSSTAVWDSTVTGIQGTNGLINYTGNTFLNSFMTHDDHTTKMLGTTTQTVTSLIATSLNTMGINNTDMTTSDYDKMGPNILAQKIYRKYILKDPENPANTSEVRISLIPLSTNITNFHESQLHGKGTSGLGTPDRNLVVDHDDIFKLRAKICVPECFSDATKIKQKRNVELLLVRPIRTKTFVSFAEAIYARGNVDLSAATSSGPTVTAVVSDPVIGDVYSENNVDIQSGGYVGGKVTAVGIASIKGKAIPDTGGIPSGADSRCDDGIGGAKSDLETLCDYSSQVYNKTDSASHVPKKPSPIPNNLGLLPTTECSTTAGWTTTPRVLVDCKITGDFSTDGKLTNFIGQVYITGDLKMAGGSGFQSTTDATHLRAPHIIVDGQIDIQGDTSGTSTISPLFVSNYAGGPPKDAIKIAGNPSTGVDHGAIFMTTATNSNVKLAGNSTTFGAVVSNGTVNTSGTSAQIRRDTNMDDVGASFPPTKGENTIKIVSWKELAEAL
jgi:hypothetical protein